MKTAISITALVAATCWLPTMVYAADMSTNQPSTTDRAKQNVSDSAITAKVKAALAIEKNVSATRISVDTDNNGVVTLRGPVRSQTEADRAVEVARGIEGVKSVTNQLQVSATTTSATPDTASRSVESSGTANRTAASERPARRDRN